MDETSLILVMIGIHLLVVVLGLLALYASLARRWGPRQAVRRIWEGALVTTVFFAVGVLGVIPLHWCHDWFLLLAYYSILEIIREGLHVEQVIKSPECVVVFSNGARHPMPEWPSVLCCGLWLAWVAVDYWIITARIARRFAPTAWAEFAENRNGGSRSH